MLPGWSNTLTAPQNSPTGSQECIRGQLVRRNSAEVEHIRDSLNLLSPVGLASRGSSMPESDDDVLSHSLEETSFNRELMTPDISYIRRRRLDLFLIIA